MTILLGRGSFGCVYKLTKGDEVFAAKVGNDEDLAKEYDMLSHLKGYSHFSVSNVIKAHGIFSAEFNGLQLNYLKLELHSMPLNGYVDIHGGSLSRKDGKDY